MAMNTIMSLTAYGEASSDAVLSAKNVITELDKQLSTEAEDSVVYAINHSNGAPVEVPSAITDMLYEAKTVYERTDGALDLTVYPLSKLWGFIGLDDSHKGSVPSQYEIDEYLKMLCFDKISVDGDKVTFPTAPLSELTSALPLETGLSFGSIAKGYTSDMVIAAMRDAGAQAAIISLGGNIQTLGQKPDGTPWKVAVDDPDQSGKYAAVLSVGETAVITSADNQRYFEQDGVRYHHIIDPKTGAPAQSGLRSVTIVCQSGMTADALSTALFVLGKDGAFDYWRAYGGFEMLLITDDDEIFCTAGLEGAVEPGDIEYPITYIK